MVPWFQDHVAHLQVAANWAGGEGTGAGKSLGMLAAAVLLLLLFLSLEI